MKRAGVIGGGAWGTALAQVCARAGLETVLWAREADVVASVNTSHENTSFLPGIELDPSIRATGDFIDLARSDLVLAVAPAQHLRSTLMAFAPHVRDGLPILLCSKGVEQGTLKLMTEVLAETIPQAAPERPGGRTCPAPGAPHPRARSWQRCPCSRPEAGR